MASRMTGRVVPAARAVAVVVAALLWSLSLADAAAGQERGGHGAGEGTTGSIPDGGTIETMPTGGTVGAMPTGDPGECGAPFRLNLFPTASLPCAGTFLLEFGQTTTLTRGISEPIPGTGSGNQTYIIRADHGITDRFALSYLFDYNDDPTWERINGERPQKKIFTLGAGARIRAWADGRTRIAAEGALVRLGLKSDPGLFTDEPGFEWKGYLAGAFGVMVDRSLAGGWTGTLSTSVTFLPEANGTRPLFGRSHLLGAGIQGRVHPRVRVFATGDLVLGPGHNHIDAQGRFRRVPLASAGLIYSVNPQLRITAYGTNQAGGSQPTRHLTLLGSVPLEAGVRVQWDPMADLAPGVDAEWLHGTVTATADHRNGQSFRFTTVLARDFSGDIGFSWTPGLLARDRFGLRLGGEAQYRIGAVVRLARRDAGAPVDVNARLTIGRSFRTQQGYLVGEVRVSGTAGPRLSWEVTPTLAQNGGDTPVGVELRAGVGLALGLEAYLSPLVILTPQPTPWTGGLLSPWWGGFRLELFGSTAQSPMGIGRFLSVSDEPRFGLALHARW